MTASETIRQQFDPDGELPQVELQESSSPIRMSSSFNAEHLVITQDGEVVGKTNLYTNPSTNEAWLAHPEVTKPGGGYGSALYLAVIEKVLGEGKTMRTDKVVSKSAARVWQRFVDAGIAEVLEPLTPTGKYRPDGQEMYRGHVQVRPTSSNSESSAA